MPDPPNSATPDFPVATPDEWRELGAAPTEPKTLIEQISIPWRHQEDVLTLVQETEATIAAVLLACGIVWWLFCGRGWRGLTAVNIGALGAWAGWVVGTQTAGGPAGGMSGLVIGTLVAGVVGWSFKTAAIATTGGIVGFVTGCAAWRMVGLDEGHVLAGGVIGGVFLGMIPLSFRKLGPTAVLAGEATVLVAAGLGAFAMRYAPSRGLIEETLGSYPVIAPAVLLASVACALFLHGESDSGDDA
ncbi:MAG: hypothetical protein AAF561_10280 [Planctomycetota bacterium]